LPARPLVGAVNDAVLKFDVLGGRLGGRLPERLCGLPYDKLNGGRNVGDGDRADLKGIDGRSDLSGREWYTDRGSENGILAVLPDNDTDSEIEPGGLATDFPEGYVGNVTLGPGDTTLYILVGTGDGDLELITGRGDAYLGMPRILCLIPGESAAPGQDTVP